MFASFFVKWQWISICVYLLLHCWSIVSLTVQFLFISELYTQIPVYSGCVEFDKGVGMALYVELYNWYSLVQFNSASCKKALLFSQQKCAHTHLDGLRALLLASRSPFFQRLIFSCVESKSSFVDIGYIQFAALVSVVSPIKASLISCATIALFFGLIIIHLLACDQYAMTKLSESIIHWIGASPVPCHALYMGVFQMCYIHQIWCVFHMIVEAFVGFVVSLEIFCVCSMLPTRQIYNFWLIIQSKHALVPLLRLMASSWVTQITSIWYDFFAC